SGPVTDYAINTHLNLPSDNPPWFTNNQSIGHMDARQTITGITDGSSNTILAGEKALTISHQNDDHANSLDESVVRGGDGGTGRNGNNIPGDNIAALNSYLLWPDKLENGTTPDVQSNHFGGPFPGGVLFMMVDGSVRSINYSVPPR